MDRVPSYADLSAPGQLLRSGRDADAWRLADGVRVTVRAARPDDGPLMQALVRGLSTVSRYQRFFYPLRELPPLTLARFSHADPLHEMTLLAVVQQGAQEVAVGMAQYVADPSHATCEFALVVSDAWQRKGIAARLLNNLVCVARAAGMEQIEGEILADNEGMRHLLGRLGFSIGPHPDGAYLRKTWRTLAVAVEPACSPLAVLAAQAVMARAAA